MKYELKELDEIISVSLRPAHVLQQKNRTSYIRQLQEQVISEVDRIRNVFLNTFYDCQNERALGVFVNQQMRKLTELADLVFQYSNKSSNESIYTIKAPQFSKEYNFIQEKIHQLIDFIRIHYAKFVDNSQKIPKLIRNTHQSAFTKTLNRARIIFATNEIDPTLQQIVFAMLGQIVTDSELSYRRFEYLKLLQLELNNAVKSEKLTEQVLINLLLEYNYNNADFVEYYIQRTTGDSTNARGLTDLTEAYYFQLKLINQQLQKTKLSFDEMLPNVKERIGTWLAEEIYFLEKKQEIEYSFNETRTGEKVIANKVQTNLSVAHLSLAVKLLLNTGIIKNKNATELMRMVAKNFRTEKSEHISEDSLRNKAYNVETAAVDGMKDVIIGLLNEVRKY